jgi:hypothetical protein
MLEYAQPASQPTPVQAQQPAQDIYISQETPQPAQQPAPQAPMPSPEQQDVIKSEVLIDKEALDILQSAYPQYIDSIINTGIKMFSETEGYKKYMLKTKIINNTIDKESGSVEQLLNTSDGVIQPVSSSTQGTKKQAEEEGPRAFGVAAW